MTTKKLPPLYSARQFAALIGRKRVAVIKALNDGRIPASAYVDGRWVIHRDATVLRKDIPHDQFLLGLPEEFISDDYVRTPENVMDPYVPKGSKHVIKQTGLIEVIGYDRVRNGLGVKAVHRLTGLHKSTVRRLRDGKPVTPSVVWKLAEGFDVDVQDLLRR